MKKHKYLFFLLFLAETFCSAQIRPVQNYSTADILPNNTVRSLLSASDGSLWIGTDNGLARKFNNSTTYFFEEDGLPMNNVWALAEDKNNHLWIGSYGNGIAHFDGKDFTEISIDTGLIHQEITTLFVSGNYLFAGTSNGISIIDIPDKKVISSFTTSETNPMRIHKFVAFEDVVFSATYNSGLFKIEKNDLGFSYKKISDLHPIYATLKTEDSLLISHKEAMSRASWQELIHSQEPVFKKSKGPYFLGFPES